MPGPVDEYEGRHLYARSLTDRLPLITRSLSFASPCVEASDLAGGRPVCTGSITYVSVRPGSGESVPIPDDVRAAFEGAMYDGFRGSTGGGE